MMIDAVLPRFVQDKRACALTQLIKMRVHARHNSGSDVRHEKTLKFAEGKIVPGLGLPMRGVPRAGGRPTLDASRGL